MKGIITHGGLLPKTIRHLKKAAPTILTILGAAGVVVTAISAVKATPKALKLIDEDERYHGLDYEEKGYGPTKIEMVKIAWSCYIPTAIIGLTTISCIFGAHVLNKRTQATLISAYGFMHQSYQKYKSAAKKVYGEDADRKIVEQMNQGAYARGAFSCAEIYHSDTEKDEDKLWFYDSFGKRSFQSTLAAVINAEYFANRDFAMNGFLFLNQFYNFLGIPETQEGDIIGWAAEPYYENCISPWLEFSNDTTTLEDGMECYTICNVFEDPYVLSEDYH